MSLRGSSVGDCIPVPSTSGVGLPPADALVTPDQWLLVSIGTAYSSACKQLHSMTASSVSALGGCFCNRERHGRPYSIRRNQFCGARSISVPRLIRHSDESLTRTKLRLPLNDTRHSSQLDGAGLTAGATFLCGRALMPVVKLGGRNRPPRARLGGQY